MGGECKRKAVKELEKGCDSGDLQKKKSSSYSLSIS